MRLQAFDIVRLLVFALFGIGAGFMFMTNIIAFMILRPPKKFGFLWWHVTAISLSFLCLGVIATEAVVTKVGDPPGLRSVVVLLGMTLYAVAQVIIFSVERRRLVESRALAVALVVPDLYVEP